MHSCIPLSKRIICKTLMMIVIALYRYSTRQMFQPSTKTYNQIFQLRRYFHMNYGCKFEKKKKLKTKERNKKLSTCAQKWNGKWKKMLGSCVCLQDLYILMIEGNCTGTVRLVLFDSVRMHSIVFNNVFFFLVYLSWTWPVLFWSGVINQHPFHAAFTTTD